MDVVTCSFYRCNEPAVWDRKEGWSVAPGSPPGPVCETHHCWEPLCGCGQPNTPGTVHRVGAPCYSEADDADYQSAYHWKRYVDGNHCPACAKYVEEGVGDWPTDDELEADDDPDS